MSPKLRRDLATIEPVARKDVASVLRQTDGALLDGDA